MRLFMLSISAGLLASCSVIEPAELKQCEEYLTAKLRSPSTYKRVKHTSIGIPFNAPKEWSVIIEYDAANAYGTPIRDKQICIYPVKGGRPDTSGYIDFDEKFSVDPNLTDAELDAVVENAMRNGGPSRIDDQH